MRAGGTATPPLHHSFPYTIGLEPRSRVWKPGLREWSEGPGLVGIAGASANVDDGGGEDAAGAEGAAGEADRAGRFDNVAGFDGLAGGGKESLCGGGVLRLRRPR